MWAGRARPLPPGFHRLARPESTGRVAGSARPSRTQGVPADPTRALQELPLFKILQRGQERKQGRRLACPVAVIQTVQLPRLSLTSSGSESALRTFSEDSP